MVIVSILIDLTVFPRLHRALMTPPWRGLRRCRWLAGMRSLSGSLHKDAPAFSKTATSVTWQECPQLRRIGRLHSWADEANGLRGATSRWLPGVQVRNGADREDLFCREEEEHTALEHPPLLTGPAPSRAKTPPAARSLRKPTSLVLGVHQHLPSQCWPRSRTEPAHSGCPGSGTQGGISLPPAHPDRPDPLLVWKPTLLWAWPKGVSGALPRQSRTHSSWCPCPHQFYLLSHPQPLRTCTAPAGTQTNHSGWGVGGVPWAFPPQNPICCSQRRPHILITSSALTGKQCSRDPRALGQDPVLGQEISRGSKANGEAGLTSVTGRQDFLWLTLNNTNNM